MMGNMVNLKKHDNNPWGDMMDNLTAELTKFLHDKKYNDSQIVGFIHRFDLGGFRSNDTAHIPYFEFVEIIQKYMDTDDDDIGEITTTIITKHGGDETHQYGQTPPTVNINKPCTSSTTNEYCRADDCPAYNYCDGTLPHKPTVDITKFYIPCNKIGCAYNRTTTINGVPVKPQCSIPYMTPTHIDCLNT